MELRAEQGLRARDPRLPDRPAGRRHGVRVRRRAAVRPPVLPLPGHRQRRRRAERGRHRPEPLQVRSRVPRRDRGSPPRTRPAPHRRHRPPTGLTIPTLTPTTAPGGPATASAVLPVAPERPVPHAQLAKTIHIDPPPATPAPPHPTDPPPPTP